MTSVKKFEVDFLDLSGLIDNDCFQLLSIIEENESVVSREEISKENCSTVPDISSEDNLCRIEVSSDDLNYDKPEYIEEQNQVEDPYYIDIPNNSVSHPAYAKAQESKASLDFHSQSHPVTCNQSVSSDFTSQLYTHGGIHGVSTGQQHYSNAHPNPSSTRPNVAGSGGPQPPNIYSHIPQPHMIPPTVYVEHCHVNVANPYGTQPHPNIYIPHQSYPNPYASFMMNHNDLSSSAPVNHVQSNYEKEQEHRSSRGSYRSRGRGQGRGKKIPERSNSGNSEHSSYGDMGRNHYESTPLPQQTPLPPMAIPNPHYPPRYANHQSYMYASTVPIMQQSQQYAPGHFSNSNIIYNHPHIPTPAVNVATFGQTQDSSTVQVCEESSQISDYVMQAVEVTSSNSVICGEFDNSNLVYSGKMNETVSNNYTIEESARVGEPSFDVAYVNSSDPTFFEQPDDFHLMHNSGDSYSHSYASSESDRPHTDYSGGHSPVIETVIKAPVEDVSSYSYTNFVKSEHSPPLPSAGTNVSSPCFVPNEKAHPISIPIIPIVKIKENSNSQTDINIPIMEFVNLTDFSFMSTDDVGNNLKIGTIQINDYKQSHKKLETKKAKKSFQESVSTQIPKIPRPQKNIIDECDSLQNSPKVSIDQKTLVNAKKLNTIEPKVDIKSGPNSLANNELNGSMGSSQKPPTELVHEIKEVDQTKSSKIFKAVDCRKNAGSDLSNYVEAGLNLKPEASAAPVWNGGKSWAQILVKPNANSSKQVAFVHPFNANESQDEVSIDENNKNNSVESGLNGDEVKFKIGSLLSNYLPDYKPVHLQPRGLINKNYWCYVNAPLQALLACPSIYQLMKSLSKESGTGSGNLSTPFINSFVDFVNNFVKLSKKDKLSKKEPQIAASAPFEPNVIYKMLINSKKNQFTEGRQQDAEEMLSFVLNGLHDEMVESLKLSGHNNEEDNEEEAAIENELEENEENEWKVQGPKKKSCVTRSVHLDKSPISDIFWGTFRSVLQKAGNTTANLQPFNTIPLDIQSPKVDTLREALSQLVAKEEISGLSCSKTNKEVTASNQVVIESLPRVLILHLKRFIYDNEGGLQKVDKKLDFSIDLDITKDLLSQVSRGKYSLSQRRYKLIAVVSHEGKEATKGHYIADVHHPGYNCWIRYDDSSVKVISEVILQKHDPPRVPYLLFYRRCDTNKNNGQTQTSKDTK